MMMDAPPAEFADAELSVAWVTALEAKCSERDATAVEILAAQEKVDISHDDRSSLMHQLFLKKTRIDNDLIALGQVLEIARRRAMEQAQAAAAEAAQEQV